MHTNSTQSDFFNIVQFSRVCVCVCVDRENDNAILVRKVENY